MKLTLLVILFLGFSLILSMRVPKQIKFCSSYSFCVTSQETKLSVNINAQPLILGELKDTNFKQPLWKCFESKISYNDILEISVENDRGSDVGIAMVDICDSQINELTNPYDWSCDNEGVKSIPFSGEKINGIPSQYITKASTTPGAKTTIHYRLNFNPEPRIDATLSFVIDDFHDYIKINLYKIPDNLIAGENQAHSSRSVKITFREGDRIEIKGGNGSKANLSNPKQTEDKDVALIAAVLKYKDQNVDKFITTSNEFKWFCNNRPPFIVNEKLVGNVNKGFSNLKELLKTRTPPIALVGIWGDLGPGNSYPKESVCILETGTAQSKQKLPNIFGKNKFDCEE